MVCFRARTLVLLKNPGLLLRGGSHVSCPPVLVQGGVKPWCPPCTCCDWFRLPARQLRFRRSGTKTRSHSKNAPAPIVLPALGALAVNRSPRSNSNDEFQVFREKKTIRKGLQRVPNVQKVTKRVRDVAETLATVERNCDG